MMNVLEEAIIYATVLHQGQMRKMNRIPDILHPLEAAVIVSSMSEDQELIAAAVLHDVVKDAGIPMDEIESRFGKRVRMLVECETEDKREGLPAKDTWMIRKEESLQKLKDANDPAVMMLWIGDKLANIRSIYRDWKEEGDAMWQRFNQSDPKIQAWYYNTIAELTKPLSHTAAWIEYNALTQLVFEKGR